MGTTGVECCLHTKDLGDTVRIVGCFFDDDGRMGKDIQDERRVPFRYRPRQWT